jgi:hypothetical protein
MPPRSTTLLLLAVLGLTAVAHLPVLTNEFVNFDDRYLIVDNPLVNQPGWESFKGVFARQLFTPHYKPLVYLSWMAEYALVGASPFLYHLDNLLLHLLNCLLVFILVLQLAPAAGLSRSVHPLLAGGVALLFGLHPIHVESVAWAAERKDVLHAALYLGAAISYSLYARSGYRRRAALDGAAVLYGLALLAKSMAITFAVVPFLIDRLLVRRPGLVLRDKIAFLFLLVGAAVLYGLVPHSGFGSGETAGATGLAPLEANLRLWAFLGHLLVPVQLSVLYPGEELLARFGVLRWPAAALSLATLVWVMRESEQRRWGVFGLSFFVVALSPALVAAVGGSNYLSDRYLYVASVGILAVLVWLAVSRSERRGRTAGMALVAALALLWGALTYDRCTVWRTSETLWSDVIAKFPGQSHVAYLNRGNYYFERQRYREALEDYARSLEVRPANSRARLNRGIVFARLGRLEAACEEFDAALALNSRLPEAYLHRGMARTLLGETEAAEGDYAVYLSFYPKRALAHYWRGLNRQLAGEHRRAIVDFERAIELDPLDERFGRSRDESLAILGRPSAEP